MSGPSIDWRLLGGAAVLLALAAVVSLTLLLGSRSYLAQTQATYLRQRAGLVAAARLYRTAENDRSLYSQYVSRYRELARQGVIGVEPRLDWIEALERINRRLKLPVLRYEIQPQALLTLPPERYNTKIVRIYRSSMSPTAGLLHEGDLIALLHELRRLTSGRFEVHECRVKFTSPARGVSLDPGRATLTAVCAIDWYTLRLEPGAAREAPASW